MVGVGAMVSVLFMHVSECPVCTGVLQVFLLLHVFGNFDMGENRAKECNEKQGQLGSTQAGKMIRLQGADGYEMSSMRTYTVVLPSRAHSQF